MDACYILLYSTFGAFVGSRSPDIKHNKTISKVTPSRRLACTVVLAKPCAIVAEVVLHLPALWIAYSSRMINAHVHVLRVTNFYFEFVDISLTWSFTHVASS